MKLLSWNVNGIRAVGKTTFSDWFEKEAADLVCVQETKARAEQLDEKLLHPMGYHSYWHHAEKAGYSGVAVYAKREPLSFQVGIGDPEIDREGRVLVLEYERFVLINAYFPNSQRDHARLGYKLKFCEKMFQFLRSYREQGKNVILCGDFNIAHREIDLRNPKSNAMNAGFLPEERAWMEKFLSSGYVDAFRNFTADPDHYTWWSYMPGVREKNIGWRIDYFVVNEEFKEILNLTKHQPHIRGSDHCPVELGLRT